MRLMSEHLPDFLREIEKRMPVRRGNYRVEPATDARHAEHIIELDKHPGGFLPPNKMSPKHLKALWKKDKSGFYVLYRGNTPIGYCDMFGLDPKHHFIDNLKNSGARLDLPDPEELCECVVPREEWGGREIEMYIDAILVLQRKNHLFATYNLMREVCRNLLKAHDVHVTQLATVAVQNSPISD